jgi:dTDP-4-dehydrorhamnose 3,5-epimerase
MQLLETDIPDVKILRPPKFQDERGYFMESYNQRAFNEVLGLSVSFVQDNQSRSSRNVLRGLHYQLEQPQGKLVRVLSGEIFDVAVDLRRRSPFFGHHVTRTLTAENAEQMWIPPGFAHGFLVLSSGAELLYKTTDFYAPQFERTLAWDDSDLGIKWPLTSEPILSDKDRLGQTWLAAETYS